MLNLSRLLCALLLVCASVTAQDQDLRDPTTPLAGVSPGVTGDEPRLQSILIRAADKLAIISGETVREGDALSAFGDVVVERIDSDQVVIRRGDKRETLRVINDYRISKP